MARIKCLWVNLLSSALLLSFFPTSCLGIPAADDTHHWSPHTHFPPFPWPGIPLTGSLISFIWLYPTNSWPYTHNKTRTVWTRQSCFSLVWGAQPCGPAWPQFPTGQACKKGFATIRDFQFVQTACECSSDCSLAGVPCFAYNAGPGWSWGSCDNLSSCHSGCKCSFTTLRPGAIMICFSPAGAVPAAARACRGHQSPLSFTTFCSLLITVNYNGRTAHFSRRVSSVRS